MADSREEKPDQSLGNGGGMESLCTVKLVRFEL